MSLNRRKFTKLAVLGGASAVTSSSIFFPKPAESSEIFDFLLGRKTTGNIFNDLILYAGVKLVNHIFSPPPVTQSAMTTAQQNFQEQGFTQNRTPNGTIRDTNLIWGTQKQEDVGPNPGFSIIQPSNNYGIETAQFTGPTAVGIDRSSKVLADKGFSPLEVADLVFPWRETYEDWSSWSGDYDPETGKQIKGISFAEYETRGNAIVTRRYERLEPNLGRVIMRIQSRKYTGKIVTNVKFNGTIPDTNLIWGTQKQEYVGSNIEAKHL